MKKLLTLIAFLGFHFVCLAQVPIKILRPKADPAKDKMVSYEFTLTHISVAEASRDRIDNNDCRQTWGEVSVWFYELDANGQNNYQNPIKTDLEQEYLFQKHFQQAAHWSKSYYQDRRGVSNDEYIKRISVRVSENMVKNRRIVAIVSCKLRTAHKDNDLATFDRLRMISALSATFYLEDIPSKEESMSVITNGQYTFIHGSEVSGGGSSDDSHRIWLHFTIKKKP